MVRSLVLASVVAIVAGCGGARGGGAGTGQAGWYPLGDVPLPPPSERCFVDRYQAYGRSVEVQVRLRLEPQASRIVWTVDDGSGGRRRTTVMTVDGNRFSAAEEGPGGEARGEGTLHGSEWAWWGWEGTTRRAGREERVRVHLSGEAMTVESEDRTDAGAPVVSRQELTAVACAAMGARPMETLYPPGERPPAAP